MQKRTSYPEGVPCWIDIEQPDPDAAATFYGGLFGWDFEDRKPPVGRYLIARLGDRVVAGIGTPPPGAPPDPSWNTYIAVADADASAAKVVDAGGRVVAGPMDLGPVGRWAACADPGGAHFRLWQAGARTGAEVVNEPGSWNWSDLATTDPGQAEAFYGSVFGWEATAVALGEASAGMWRVPGYGDHLARSDPELRERQAAAGAPPGFADAIGWVGPLEPEGGAGPDEPHWRVTFAVDGTDAAVDRALGLGGRLLRPAADDEYTRTAVLQDPQGAVLTVSTFTPS